MPIIKAGVEVKSISNLGFSYVLKPKVSGSVETLRLLNVKLHPGEIRSIVVRHKLTNMTTP